MWKKFIKIAWRALLRQQVFAAINILGLSFGLASCLILVAFVKHDRSYDSYHPEPGRIFRVVQNANNSSNWSWTGGALAPMLKNAFPDNLDHVVRINVSSKFISNAEGHGAEESFSEENFLYADPGFEEMFSFELKEGSWMGWKIHSSWPLPLQRLKSILR